MNPGAACQAPGIAHGTCTNVPGRTQTERECRCTGSPPTPPPAPGPPVCKTVNICPATAPLANNLFYIRDLGHRCIDAGLPPSWVAGAPVFINACNGTLGQQIRVTEIDGTHDVGLSVQFIPTIAPPNTLKKINGSVKAQRTATGATNTIYCIGVHGGTVAPGAALELQTCNASSPAQRFAVDGDAIMMGAQSANKVTREFVIERQNGSTVLQTPLVVATRVVSEEEPLRIDARYFRFAAADGSGAELTSSFLTVSDEPHLICAAQCGWGTVVQIDDKQPLVLTELADDTSIPGGGVIPVEDGTTIRGYRSYTYQGPEIRTCVLPTDMPVFLATGQAVRFTGFQLDGPNGDSRCGQTVETALPKLFGSHGEPNPNQPAIQVSRYPFWSLTLPSVWIDHMEISHWTAAGTSAGAPDFPGDPDAQPSPCTNCGYPDTPIAVMVGNLMHDDVYEAGPGGGQFSQIRANLFFETDQPVPLNQPVASREMSCLGGYAAVDNLFLTEASSGASDDVDMHGSKPPGNWSSGLAGDYFDVGWNTFLKVAQSFLWWNPWAFQNNVNERGYSCRFTKVHDNIFLQAQKEGNALAIRDPFNPPIEYGNIFSAQDPTMWPTILGLALDQTKTLLLVGDFDGDGADDVFLATGAAWYYSSGGQAEWRYLNRMPEVTSNLLLGDFDGDGRTDVLTIHGSNGGNIDVSWAGVSPWQTINVVAWPLSDLAVGDFDGDGRSDLLLATGKQWFFASGGWNWVPFVANTLDYTYTIPNLRFGHFTDKSKTQILRVENNHWKVTELGMNSWVDIGEAPVDSVTGLVAGDFDGDGYTELARSSLLQWQYTSPRRGSSWTSLGWSTSPIQNKPIGNFQGGAQDGVIWWSNNNFYYTHTAGSQIASQLLSRQVMR
jgi:hypothetical protein